MSKVSFAMTEVHGSQIIVHMDGDEVVQIDCWGETYTHSYLPSGKLYVASCEWQRDTTAGAILPLSQEEMMDIYLNGGSFYVYVEDLATFKVLPSWWSIEATMAAEGDAPEWPLSEDEIGGAPADAIGLIGAVFGALIGIIGDDDEDEEVGTEAPDWVKEALAERELTNPDIKEIKDADWERRFTEMWGDDPIPNDDDDPDIV